MKRKMTTLERLRWRLAKEANDKIVAKFRPVSHEHCKRYRLCTTSAKSGKVHCAKRAKYTYPSPVKSVGRIFLCEDCFWKCLTELKTVPWRHEVEEIIPGRRGLATRPVPFLQA